MYYIGFKVVRNHYLHFLITALKQLFVIAEQNLHNCSNSFKNNLVLVNIMAKFTIQCIKFFKTIIDRLMPCSSPPLSPLIRVRNKTPACLILDRSPRYPRSASTFSPGCSMEPSFDENIEILFITPGLWGPFTQTISPVCMRQNISQRTAGQLNLQEYQFLDLGFCRQIAKSTPSTVVLHVLPLSFLNLFSHLI